MLIRKLSQLVSLSSDEITLLEEMRSRKQFVRRHREVISQGRAYEALFVLNEGFAIRSRVLRSGDRQILGVIIPGDFIGFPACFFERALYSVQAITDLVVSPITYASIASLFENHPRVAAKIFWSFACEAGIYVEHLVSLGQRSAIERVAHFLLELHARLRIIGLADEKSYAMPLTQEQIGDALGLTVQHINRTLRRLREENLAIFENHRVTITDIEALSALAEFENPNVNCFRIPGFLSRRRHSRV